MPRHALRCRCLSTSPYRPRSSVRPDAQVDPAAFLHQVPTRRSPREPGAHRPAATLVMHSHHSLYLQIRPRSPTAAFTVEATLPTLVYTPSRLQMSIPNRQPRSRPLRRTEARVCSMGTRPPTRSPRGPCHPRARVPLSTGSLSSLLNPSGGQYPRPLQSSYGGPFSGVTVQGTHSTSSVSPDSRPTTGYSLSSVSSLPYDTEGTSTGMSHDYSRPNSGHHRPLSPRPHSSHKLAMNSGGYTTSNQGYAGISGSAIRRQRRHSQAMSPYPSPYDNSSSSNGSHHLDSPIGGGMHHRPSTSPQPLTPGGDAHQHHSHSVHHPQHQGISRVRSMVQLPAVDTTGYAYSSGNGNGDFAYSAGGSAGGHNGGQAVSPGASHMSSVDAMDWNRGVRPSTSTSSLSGASHASSSQANTPPVDAYGAGEDINRCEYSLLFSFSSLLLSLVSLVFLVYPWCRASEYGSITEITKFVIMRTNLISNSPLSLSPTFPSSWVVTSFLICASPPRGRKRSKTGGV